MATTSASMPGPVPVSGSKANNQTFTPQDGRIVPPICLLERTIMTEAELRLSYRIERTVFLVLGAIVLTLLLWQYL